MKRVATILIVAAALTFVGGSASETQACKLLTLLFHRCHACHHCGHFKCHYRRCHRPKCHCQRHAPPPVYYGPRRYVEPVEPEYVQPYRAPRRHGRQF